MTNLYTKYALTLLAAGLLVSATSVAHASVVRPSGITIARVVLGTWRDPKPTPPAPVENTTEASSTGSTSSPQAGSTNGNNSSNGNNGGAGAGNGGNGGAGADGGVVRAGNVVSSANALNMLNAVIVRFRF